MSSCAFSTHTLHGTLQNHELLYNKSSCFSERLKKNFISSGLSHLKMTWRQTGRLQCRALNIESNRTFLKGGVFQFDDVIEAQQFDREILSAIFEVAREMETIEKKSRGNQLLKGYLMATLFYEPSTRTRLSFESAMKRLGGEVLTTENAREFSSAAKGETLEGGVFQFDDVIEAQQFDREILSAIFEVAREMETIEKKSRGNQLLKGYLMATLFYEPSTRTRLSFESAMKRLGGEVLTTENAREFSSAAKGETLEDTIRTVEGYSDIIVMRHFESGAARRAAMTANIPVINAGDGPGEHPTQALLDVYTIEREIGKLDGIKVGLVGDLANGRTVRSLAYLLAKYNDVKIYFVSPEVVKMKDDIKEYLTSKGIEWEESADLIEVASKCDVVYQTRIQRERFGERIDLYDEARGKYIVNRDILCVMQKHAVVMHPLPRLDEITVEVDGDPRAAYFRQTKNGLFIRMALLKLLLVGW